MHSHRPLWHCLAFAGTWYVAIVLLNLFGDDAGVALRTALLGVVPWLGASVALTRLSGSKAWQLTLLALPIFFFLWAVTVVVAARFAAPPAAS